MEGDDHSRSASPSIQEAVILSAQSKRFLDLHPRIPNAEEKFRCFCSIFGLNALQEYLDALEKLCDELDKDKTWFARIWCILLTREISFSTMVVVLDIESNESLQRELSRLAFIHQHPSISRDCEISHAKRVQAIDSRSYEEAEEILENRVRSEIVAEGYDHPYIDSRSIVDQTLKTLAEYANNWQLSQYLAPYASLIGSSMIGKTRLLMELSKHTCVVYICIRPLNSTSSGYPPQSKYASSILLDHKCTTMKARYEFLLLSILHTVADFFSAQQDTQTERERLEQWFDYSFPKKDQLSDPPFWTDVENKLNVISERYRMSHRIHLQIHEAITRMMNSTRFIRQSNLRLILAIDDARGLLERSESTDVSFFHTFCSVLKEVPTASGFFSILSDTITFVPDYKPPPEHPIIPSRPGWGSLEKLFPPIYAIPTFDIHVSGRPANWLQLQSAFRLFRYGSPFWSVYVGRARERNQAATEIVTALIEIATEKLIATQDTSLPATSLTETQAIALLGPTIQPAMYGANKMNCDLIWRHAAQCLYIDPSQEITTSVYPSQFTLSSAANQYLALDDARLIRCIEVLISYRRLGCVSSPYMSEIVSRIVLLRAMQETMRRTQPTSDAETDPESVTMPFGHSVRLADFLETLTGLDQNDLNLGSISKPNKDKLLNHGRVFWNHFISIEHTPSSEDFLEQLFRGAAVQCKPEQAGFNHLFPIYLQPKPKSILSENIITFCGVQVPNIRQSENLDDESHQWTPGHAGIELKKPNPYLVLYFNLNKPEPEPETLDPRALEPRVIPIPANTQLSAGDSKRRAALAFYGLHAFPFLTPGLISALDGLLDAYPHIFSAIHRSSKIITHRYINHIFPETSNS